MKLTSEFGETKTSMTGGHQLLGHTRVKRQNDQTRSAAQGSGRSFKDNKLEERWVVVTQGWQSKLTDGSNGG